MRQPFRCALITTIAVLLWRRFRARPCHPGVRTPSKNLYTGFTFRWPWSFDTTRLRVKSSIVTPFIDPNEVQTARNTTGIDGSKPLAEAVNDASQLAGRDPQWGLHGDHTSWAPAT